MKTAQQLWTVYRHFDCDGELLYIGMTKDLDKRTAQHAARSLWFDDVALIDNLGHFDTKEQAAGVERRAIREFKPQQNLMHTGRKTRGEKLPSLRENLQEIVDWLDSEVGHITDEELDRAWLAEQEQATARGGDTS